MLAEDNFLRGRTNFAWQAGHFALLARAKCPAGVVA